MKRTKKASAAVFTLLMLSMLAIGVSQVGTASAALPWDRPTSPVWVPPEEVQPWSPAVDTLAPRLNIKLRFAKKESVDSGKPHYREYEAQYSVVNGKAHYRFPLIRAYTGGKLEIYVYVAEPENALYETSGLKKSSCKALVGDSWKSMGEYGSTVGNTLEGRFVLYVKLKEGQSFAVGATGKDNAGNVVSTLDSVTYEIVTRAPVPSAEDGEEEEEEKEAQADPKAGPKGTTHDPDAPPGPAKEGAHWYVMKLGFHSTGYPGKGDRVGFIENMNRKESAYSRWWSASLGSDASDDAYSEYQERRGRQYTYYEQDGTKYATLTCDIYTPLSGYP
jgi:hypothetical protein